MHLGVDASVLNNRRTGVGNYVYELLIRLVNTTDWTFTLYSNLDIVFPEHERVNKVVHRPYRKGAGWLNLQLMPQLFKDKPDCFWGGNGYLPVFSPKKTATVVTIHDLVYHFAGDTMPLISRLSRRLLQPMAAKGANACVCVSQATADDVLAFYHVHATQIINPQLSTAFTHVTQQNIDEAKETLKLKQPYFLVLGTLEPRKNLSALVKAYVRAKQQIQTLPLLAIAGGKGWLAGELPELIAQHEAQGLVKKLGFVDDKHMQGLYAGAEAFIFPSIHEGYGMPVREAQLCKTPTIVSNIASLKEAGGDITATFEPTEEGIFKALLDYSNQALPLVCRLLSDIEFDPDAAAEKMRVVLHEATYKK